jgi:hypothetical protein
LSTKSPVRDYEFGLGFSLQINVPGRGNFLNKKKKNKSGILPPNLKKKLFVLEKQTFYGTWLTPCQS